MRSQKCIHIVSGSIFKKVMGKKPQILKVHLVTPPADPGSNPAEGEVLFSKESIKDLAWKFDPTTPLVH